MQDVGEFTRQAPDKRMMTLRAFSRRIAQTPRTVQELDNWGLSFGQDLMQVPGRILQPEPILWAGGRQSKYNVDNAEWNFR